jgi:hypothetical protein
MAGLSLEQLNDFSQGLVGSEGEEDVDVVGEAIHIGKANILAVSLLAHMLKQGSANGSSKPGMTLMGGPNRMNPDSGVRHSRRWVGLKAEKILLANPALTRR